MITDHRSDFRWVIKIQNQRPGWAQYNILDTIRVNFFVPLHEIRFENGTWIMNDRGHFWGRGNPLKEYMGS